MTTLLDRITSRLRSDVPEKRMSFSDYIQLITTLNFGGHQYQLGQTYQGWGQNGEGSPEFASHAARMGGSGVVFACMAARLDVFSQIRYQFQHMDFGRPGDLYGTAALRPLSRPWPGGTTANLNSRLITFGDLAGNAFVTRNAKGHMRFLRPDWCTIISGSSDPDAPVDGIEWEPIGIWYKPPNAPGVPIPMDEVAHYAPYPDPWSPWRGMSWLTPVIRNIQSHQATTEYKYKFFSNGGTPNMIVKVDPSVSMEYFKEFKAEFIKEYFGLENAYKALFLGGGADATVVGAHMDQLSFKEVQGADETIIAAAARVPAIIAGISEGLQGSSLNQGNYQAAKRQFADGPVQHLAQEAAGSLEVLIPAPALDDRLWFDTRDVPFFRDDAKDEADIRYKDSQTVRNYLDAGVLFPSIKKAIATGDLMALEHSGLFSVQLQKPGSAEVVTVPTQAAAALLEAGWRLAQPALPARTGDDHGTSD